jgi:capsular polysaccharide transport system permease protein
MNAPIDPAALPLSLPGRTRRGWRRRGFLIAVALPSLLVFLYLAFIAPPQYVAGFRYSVSSEAGGVSSSGGLALTEGTPSSHYAFVVQDYVVHQQIVADLVARLRLAGLFKPPGHDVLFRFWWDDGSIERLTRYWRNWVVDSRFDTYAGIGSVEVRTFTPQDALKLAQTVQELSEVLVNQVGQRARDDSVAAVEAEVARADARLQDVQKRIEDFRQAQQTYTPSSPAGSTETLAATLQQNIAAMNAQYSTLGRTLSPTAPAMVSLKSQLAASHQELERVLQMLGDGGPQAAPPQGGVPAPRARLPGALTAFAYLDAERGFAASAREVALKHLEEVRFNAAVQHLYLEVHSKPQLPKWPLYPRRVLWTAMTFVALSVCWMIGTLLFFAMRDHTR